MLGSSLVQMGEWKRLVDYCLLLFADLGGFQLNFWMEEEEVVVQ
jgi:hypothetical protein